MSDPIVIFRGTSGLNTVADPARIPMSNDAISDVAELVNMRIDQYNRPSKRVGQTVKSEGKFHSLYCDNGDCFVAKDNATATSIYKVNNDGSIRLDVYLPRLDGESDSAYYKRIQSKGVKRVQGTILK